MLIMTDLGYEEKTPTSDGKGVGVLGASLQQV